MKTPRTERMRKKVDPVLADQGGRSMPVDPVPVQVMKEATVRRRAFEIYEKRGKQDGRAVEDWLTAESEITDKQ